MGDNSKESKDPSFPPNHLRLSLLSLFKRKRSGVDTLFIKEEAPEYTNYAQSKEANGEHLLFCDPNHVNGAQKNDNENLCAPSDQHEKSCIKFPSASEDLNQDLFDEAVCDKRYEDKLEKCLPNFCFDGNFLKSNAENAFLKSFDESSHSENLLPEEYVEVNGQYFEARSLAFSVEEDLKEIESISYSNFDEQYSVPLPENISDSDEQYSVPLPENISDSDEQYSVPLPENISDSEEQYSVPLPENFSDSDEQYSVPLPENISDSDEQYSVPVPSCVDEGLNEAKNVSQFEDYSKDPVVEHYGWSCVIETEEERNQIYDRWISDIESWERNRLMWLDNVALSEGFNSSHNKDRTFLVKVENLCNMSQFEPVSQCKVLAELNAETDGLISNHRKMISREDVSQAISCTPSDIQKESESLNAAPLPTTNDCVEPTLTEARSDESPIWEISGKGVSWEDWYDHMRLQSHKRLLEMGLPNWFEDLYGKQKSDDIALKSDNSSYQYQSSEDVEVLSVSYSSDQDHQSENCEVDTDSIGATDQNFEKHFEGNGEQEERYNDPSLIAHIPYEYIRVYQFTDRHLWNKFRKWPNPKPTD